MLYHDVQLLKSILVFLCESYSLPWQTKAATLQVLIQPIAIRLNSACGWKVKHFIWLLFYNAFLDSGYEQLHVWHILCEVWACSAISLSCADCQVSLCICKWIAFIIIFVSIIMLHFVIYELTNKPRLPVQSPK